MQLFEQETVLTSTDGNAVMLTNFRIRSTESKAWGQSQTTSILLEKISSVQFVYQSYPVLLLLAGVCAIAAFVVMQDDSGGSPLVLIIGAILLVVGYFGSRRHVCSVASDGGARIVFAISGMRSEDVLRFVDRIELAKQERVSKLCHPVI